MTTDWDKFWDKFTNIPELTCICKICKAQFSSRAKSTIYQDCFTLESEEPCPKCGSHELRTIGIDIVIPYSGGCTISIGKDEKK